MQILPHPFRGRRETAGFTFFLGDASGVTPVCYGIKTMSFIIRDARPKAIVSSNCLFGFMGDSLILSQSGGLAPPLPPSKSAASRACPRWRFARKGPPSPRGEDRPVDFNVSNSVSRRRAASERVFPGQPRLSPALRPFLPREGLNEHRHLPHGRGHHLRIEHRNAKLAVIPSVQSRRSPRRRAQSSSVRLGMMQMPNRFPPSRWWKDRPPRGRLPAP